MFNSIYFLKQQGLSAKFNENKSDFKSKEEFI